MSGARLAVRSAQAALVVALAFPASAAAAESAAGASDGTVQAATAFDAGVKAFERNEFATAAREFLRADELVPNTDALYNAISAARRAKHDGLLATAAARATSRESSAPELAARAKKTLAEVERRVTRLVLSCVPADCELAIDGEHSPSGPSYVLPGARIVAARWADGSLAERKVEAVAAGEQTITLARETRAEEGVSPAPAPVPGRKPEYEVSRTQPEAPTDRARPLSPAVVYAGAGITLALAAATTWSGIDTLKAKDQLPGTQADNDAVMSRAHRTDALLIGTVVVGAATTYVGLVWTDWSGSGSQLALQGSLGEGGALLRIVGTR